MKSEPLLKPMFDFYFFLADRLPARQDNLFRTYLWVSSLLITLSVLLYQHRIPQVVSLSGILCAGSMLVVVGCLIASLWAMRGKQPLRFPNLRDSHAWLQENPDHEETCFSSLSEHLWEIIQSEIAAKSLRGQVLRAISWALILALILFVASVMLTL